MKKPSTFNLQRPTPNRGAQRPLPLTLNVECWALNVPLYFLTVAAFFVSASAFAGNAIEADLAAVYSPSYAASVGGDDNAQVIIANTVAGSNQIQDQGGTGAHMRIAGFYLATNDLINATTTGGMVNWLAGNNANVQDAVAFGAAVGADLLVYICQYSDSATIAGVSQQPGMYSALNPGAVWSAVFAHETGGHAYGRSHSDGVLNPKTIMLHNYCGGGAAPPYLYTNPNIWFNGVQLIGDPNNNCSMGALVNGGDNSLPSAQAVADRRPRVVAGPNLNHVILHWSFTNAPGSAPAGTTNFDLVSAAPAIVRGNGATYTGNGLRIPGGTTGNTAADAIAAYIDLPNGIISSQTNLTLEIWATPLSAPNYARFFDFGRTVQGGDDGITGEYTGLPGTPAPGATQSSDDILLSAAVGTDITKQRLEAKLNGAATTLDANLATTAGVQHHYAITFTDGVGSYATNGGRWQWYRDGDAVAYLDVNFHPADIEDVNNWLGRSLWSTDAMANNDYAEVRLSNVALSRGEILANYLLGPNDIPTATATLTNSDATGATSFNAAGQWSNGAAPSGGNSYETFACQLRTPATSSAYTFAGDSLKISGGALLWKGTAGSTITVNNLTLNGGLVVNAGSGVCTLAGSLAATTNGGIFSGANGAFNLSAAISGSGPLTFLANAATLSGANGSFTGKLFVGNGQPGTVVIDSPARLGASPAAFTADQLTLNRGTLQTTATFSLNDPNRGILIAVSGGTFSVASGTTLTLACTLSSPATAANIVEGSITKTGLGTLILSSPGSTFKGTLNVDTASTGSSDGIVKVVNNQVLANAHSPIFIRNNSLSSSMLQLDGTAGNITLPQAVVLNGRTFPTAAIKNLAGTNSIAGGISANAGGGNYMIQSDGGLLTLGGDLTSIATGSRTLTFQGSNNLAVAGTITDGSGVINVAKAGGGVLTLAGNNTYTGTTAAGAGTLLVNGRIGPGTVTLSAGTALGGVGTITSSVTIPSGATLAPGISGIGTLSIGSGLTLAAGSTNVMELNKTALANDRLNVTGTLNFGGTLMLTNLDGLLAAGDSFKLFNAGNYSGAFASLSPAIPGPKLVWYTNTLATDGTLRIAAAAPPSINNFAPSGNGFLLSVTSGPPGSPYRVLSSTNLVLPLTNWTPVWTDSFNLNGSGLFTNPAGPTNAQQFFNIVVP
jgi:autotransporter-associated beta strand protein